MEVDLVNLEDKENKGQFDLLADEPDDEDNLLSSNDGEVLDQENQLGIESPTLLHLSLNNATQTPPN